MSASAAFAQAPRNLLAGRMTPSQLTTVLSSADAWHPYPKLTDRAAWMAVPEGIRTAYIKDAESKLGASWGYLPAITTLRYIRDGNRTEYDGLNTGRRARLASLVMAEVFENRGRFVDEIVNGIWAISEQTFWGSTAHLGMQKAGSGLPDAREPVVDLFAAEAAALLSWTDYLLGARLDSVSPRVRERIRYEVDRRVLTPALERNDFWWMGFGPRKDLNNWTPWIASNWLASTLVLERDPERRTRSVHKIMRVLDNFLNIYPEDGSCDEGPGYWDRAGGSLFDNLELLRMATNGSVDIYRDPLVRNIGQYIYKAHIKDDWFVNTGDAPARTTPDAALVYAYGSRISDPLMQGFAAFFWQRRGALAWGGTSLGRLIPAVLLAKELESATPKEPLLGDVWLPDLQLMAARATPGSARGLYVAAYGGHNGQSHNHNDVGNFVVFADGRPVFIDVGVEVYSAKTFGPRRYEIWTMQSGYHNTPTINGAMQGAGTQYRAESVQLTPGRDVVKFALDIAKAYPAEAGVTRWQRTVELRRGANEFVLRDDYALTRIAEPVRLNLLTPLLVDVSAPGEVRLRDTTVSRQYTLRYDRSKFTASTEEIPIADARLLPIWGGRLARVVLTGKGTALRGDYSVTLKYPE